MIKILFFVEEENTTHIISNYMARIIFASDFPSPRINSKPLAYIYIYIRLAYLATIRIGRINVPPNSPRSLFSRIGKPRRRLSGPIANWTIDHRCYGCGLTRRHTYFLFGFERGRNRRRIVYNGCVTSTAARLDLIPIYRGCITSNFVR